MKVTKLFIVLFIAAIAGNINAQDLKFGHIDIQKVVSELPEKLAADKTLQEEAQKLDNQLKVMSADLEKKYTEYMTQRDSLPDLIRATKEKEIQDYNQRIKQYNTMAQQTLGQKEQQLLQPIIQKVQKAIDEVGQENGFIYIFDISSQVVLYHSSQSVDCGPLVKTKLGSM
ncbi:OmpH family outer membrane protein [Marinilabiliaceae bacterium JC017]|nr:OmpH family outer membrane protein [Marinilabiliaceae bacterium JC017]